MDGLVAIFLAIDEIRARRRRERRRGVAWAFPPPVFGSQAECVQPHPHAIGELCRGEPRQPRRREFFDAYLEQQFTIHGGSRPQGRSGVCDQALVFNRDVPAAGTRRM